MNSMRHMNNLFFRGIKSRSQIEVEAQEKLDALRKEISASVVARFSRGNVALQQGRFVTREDMDIEKQKLNRILDQRLGTLD